MVIFLSTRAAKSERKHALNISHLLIQSRCLHHLIQAELGPHLGRHHHAYIVGNILFQLLPTLQPAALHWYPP